ncbi:MAG: hypothetical protein AAF269_01750 [Pseudomonadota bacterium]
MMWLKSLMRASCIGAISIAGAIATGHAQLLPEQDWIYISADRGQLSREAVTAISPRFDGEQLWALLWDRKQKNGPCAEIAPGGMPVQTGAPDLSLSEISELEQNLSIIDETLSDKGYELNLHKPSVPLGADPILGQGRYRQYRGGVPSRNQYVFCELGPVEAPKRLYAEAVSARDGLLSVNQRWDKLETDAGRLFETTHGRLRDLRDGLLARYDLEDSPRDHIVKNRSSWAIENGVIQALAVRTVDEMVGFEYENLDDPEERPFFMPGKFDEPFAGGRYTPGEHLENFNTAALWWQVIEYLDPAPSDLEDLIIASATEEDFRAIIDETIDNYDGGGSTGMEMVFPQLMAAYATWPNLRFGKSEYIERWITDSFGKCIIVEMDENDAFKTTDFDLAPYTAKCLEIRASSNKRGWLGSVNFEVRFPYESEKDAASKNIDNLQIAVIDDNRSRETCYERLEEQRLGLGAPCLLVPGQYRDKNEAQPDPKKRDMSARAYFFEEQLVKQGETFRARLILAAIPPEPTDKRDNPDDWKIPDQHTAELRVSLDLTGIEKGLAGENRMTSSFARKVGLAPLSAPADKLQMGIDRGIFEGDRMPVSPEIVNSVVGSTTNMMNFEDDAGNSIGIILDDPNALTGGETGAFTAQATGEVADGRSVFQNPDVDTVLTIRESEDEGITYDLVANVCLNTIQNMMMWQEADFCAGGEKREIKLFGNLPFPKYWINDNRLSVYETAAYRDLRNLRQERIAQRFGAAGIPLPPAGGNDGANTNNSRNGNDNVSTGGGAPRPGTCTVRDLAGACDCSCVAKACLTKKQESGTLTPQESSCRLSCGKKWNQCVP